MQGYVSVTKETLIKMIENCREVTNKQYDILYSNQIKKYKNDELCRCTVRKWWRLWILPKERFDSRYENEIVEFSKNRHYELFEGCPFGVYLHDRNNSLEWLNDLANLYSAEVVNDSIQLDITTFQRISKPEEYRWVWYNTIYHSVERR